MNKIYFLYWAPGSCGDLLHQILSVNPEWYTGSHFVLDSNGRFCRSMDKELLKSFPAEPNQWLLRNWSCQELDSLLCSTHKQVMMGTHSLQQLRNIKSYLKNQVVTIGITYSNHLYPAVIKNFCTKVAETDENINTVYDQNLHQLSKKFKAHNVFGAKVLKDSLVHKNLIPLQQTNEFDIAIELELLLLGDCQWFDQWQTQHSVNAVNLWLQKQDPLYRTQITANHHYIKCLGINQRATQPDTKAINLNVYHQILIQHHFPQAPKFNTHLEFKNFTENINGITTQKASNSPT